MRLLRKQWFWLIVIILLLLLIIIIFYINNSYNCKNIKSNIKKCIGEKITAMGFINCSGVKAPSKMANDYFIFDDGSKINFMMGLRNCEKYNKSLVEIKATLHECESSFERPSSCADGSLWLVDEEIEIIK